MESSHEGVSRRTVLKYGLGSLAVVTAGGSMVLSSATRVAADVVNAELFVSAGQRTTIDGLVVPFVGFGSTAGRMELPSGQLEVQTGDTVNVVIHNNSRMPVGFNVPGVSGASAAPIAPGQTRTVTFTAPARAGTFFYVGTINGSLATGQALGATGALLVLPRGPRMSVHARYPGVRARAHRQPLFGRGAPPTLPLTFETERTWLFSEINPTTARTLAGGRVSLPNDPEPEYFLINGISGMLSAEDHETAVHGHAGALGVPGEPAVIHMINTGRAPRSVHMHGNHFWVMTDPESPWLVGAMKDTVRVPPGGIVDILVPFEAPVDSFPVVLRGQKYVVHDHIEMAETASGGHYPSGMLTELIFE